MAEDEAKDKAWEIIPPSYPSAETVVGAGPLELPGPEKETLIVRGGYDDRAFFERTWDLVTRECRGGIEQLPIENLEKIYRGYRIPPVLAVALEDATAVIRHGRKFSWGPWRPGEDAVGVDSSPMEKLTGYIRLKTIEWLDTSGISMPDEGESEIESLASTLVMRAVSENSRNSSTRKRVKASKSCLDLMAKQLKPVKERPKERVAPAQPLVDIKVGHGGGVPAWSRWGRMEIYHAAGGGPRIPAMRGLARPRPAAAGMLMGDLHKIDSGGPIFRADRKYRAGRGSVLIDCSGSMSLSASMLTTLLQSMPFGTIALYGSERHDLSSGNLVIVAERGRGWIDRGRELRKALIGGGNVVDGPALHWLSRQSQPRMWVSDGHVTGVNDSTYSILTEEVFKGCEKHHIERMDGPATAGGWWEEFESATFGWDGGWSTRKGSTSRFGAGASAEDVDD